jgi:hypothetical protein
MDKLQKTDFPSHLIDPREKGRDWVLQYCKAAWSSFDNDLPREIFYHARYRYEVIMQYAVGNQSINKYRPLMQVDEASNEDWLNIDWSVLPIVPKFRRIALGKLNKVGYNIVATPIDSLANDEIQDYFANLKAKIQLREEAAKLDPSLLESPALQLMPNEAKDMEELEMQMNYTFKHQMAIEAEQGIKLVLEQNQIEKLREGVRQDLFDYGVAGYKEYIDSNGAVKVRKVNPRNILINNCKNKDFSDASYIGEITEMSISDLKQMAGHQFSEEEYEEIAKKHVGYLGNPSEWPSSLSVYNKGYDRFRIRVLDLEFFSVNEMVFESRIDRRGNKVYARGKYDEKNKRKDKFERVAYKVVYKGKWIIGTDYLFDYGLCTNMKRAKSSLMDTQLSYHLIAPEFWDMKAYGIMQHLMPMADAIQIAFYRLQNAINQARPKGIMIEMGALEDIPLGAGGKRLTPMKVLDLYNKTGTLVYRKADQQGRMTNYKPIEELENGLGRDVMNYWQIIQNNIQLIRDVTGMNEMTDGSTPDPRTLTTVAKLAYEGTNNALTSIVHGEKQLLESLANSVILRLQDVASSGEVKGYVRALGSNTMKFFKTSPHLALYEFGIFLEDKPTDDERAMLQQQVMAGQANGLLDIEDAIIIQNTDNLKVAQQLLAYKIKKRRQEEEDKAMRMQQMNAQVQQQSSMVAEQAKQQTIQTEGQVKSQLIQLEKEYDAKILEMKYKYEIELEKMRMKGKVETKKVENKGKKSVTKIKMGQPDTDAEEPVEAMAVEEEMLMVPEQEMQQQQMPQQMMQQEIPEVEEEEEVEEGGEEVEEGGEENEMEGGEEMEGEEK